MKVAFTDQDAEIVAEWLQKSRTIMGRGDASRRRRPHVARVLAKGLLRHLAKSGALTDEPLSATLKRTPI